MAFASNSDTMAADTTTFHSPPAEDAERQAFIRLNPDGFFIRHPPPPHELSAAQTSEDQLFQTIHMGGAEIDFDKWQLVVTGLVDSPFSIDLGGLRALPSRTLTSFHECYGSPLLPPTKALRRIGNVTWTGVPLRDLLARAGIGENHDRNDREQPRYIWSEGLDRGSFAGVHADRYQKDLPLDKALSPEVLVAYEMNGQPLSLKRGGPVRLVVPGWFGTNSTKWLCKITVASSRAKGPFTTTFYNEFAPSDVGEFKTRPVWKVGVNSIIVRPKPDEEVGREGFLVEGWAWSCGGVKTVRVSSEGSDDARTSELEAEVDERKDFSWQKFRAFMRLDVGRYTLVARATADEGEVQPLEMARNHVHRVSVVVT